LHKIIVNKQKCYISNTTSESKDIDFLRDLDFELSFFVPGSEHMSIFSPKKREGDKNFDGFIHLMTEDLRFPTGLFKRVKAFYDKYNKPYEIIDQRPKQLIGIPIDILPKLKEQGKVPYNYQVDAVNKAKSVDRGIIRMATGSGKTNVAALLTAAIGKETIIYVIGKDLLYQIHGLFSSLFDEKIGLIGDGNCEIGRINVATIWTIGQALGLKKMKKAEDEENEKNIAPNSHKQIRVMLGKMKVHILDECHLGACDTVQNIFNKVKPENIYGMSASPWRDDGADLLIEALFGERIVDISAKKLIKEGFLVKPIIKFLTIPPYKFKSGQYKRIYKNYITENATRNALIVKAAEKLVEQGFQTLVLFHTIKHGDRLYKAISERMPCALLSGKDSQEDRAKVKKQLENGEIQCVIASKIFDIGVDMPSLSGLIIGGGGKSSVRALQRIGRVIRKYPNKKMAAVIDFADQAPYLLNHSKKRRDVYSEEFEVQWPEEKRKQ